MPKQELVGIVVGPCCSTPGDLFFQNGLIVREIIEIGNGAKRPAEVGRKFFLTLKSKLKQILFDVDYQFQIFFTVNSYHQYQPYY